MCLVNTDREWHNYFRFDAYITWIRTSLSYYLQSGLFSYNVWL